MKRFIIFLLFAVNLKAQSTSVKILDSISFNPIPFATVYFSNSSGVISDENGDFELIPHIGNVVIKDNVDIGNNTCIDRAVLGSTILEENVKVDNLVHIAHGVSVGRNSVVIANAMVAGSVKIGSNSWIAPSSSILNKKDVGDNSLVGMGAVVTKSIEDNTIVAGNPAKFIRKIEK